MGGLGWLARLGAILALAGMVGGCAARADHSWQQADLAAPASATVLDVGFTEAGAAVVALYEPAGLYLSADGGESWRWIGQSLGGLAPMAVQPQMPGGGLWVGTGAGLYLLADDAAFPIDGVAALVYDLAGAERGVWAATEDGLYLCSAAVCEPRGPRGPALSVASSPEMVCAGMAEDGLWCAAAGGDWQRVDDAMIDLVNDIALGPDGSAMLVSRGGLHRRFGGAEVEPLALPGGATARVVDWRASLWWVGTAESGVLSSADGGLTWSAAQPASAWPEIASLGGDAGGRLLAGTYGVGLLRSNDDGATWEPVGAGPGRCPVYSLLSNDEGLLFAGTADGVYQAPSPAAPWQPLTDDGGLGATYGLAWSEGDLLAGTGGGVYRWDESGGRWTFLTEALGRQVIFSVAPDPHRRQSIWAGSWGNNVLRSVDGGSTWAPVHGGLETLSVYSLAFSPDEADSVYLGTVEGLRCSQDTGLSWAACGLDRETVFALASSPVSGFTLYAGTTSGAWRTLDGGDSWSRMALPHATTVYSIAVVAERPDLLVAGTEGRGVWRSGDGGRTWHSWGLEGRSVYALLVLPDGTVMAGTDDGLYWTQP